MQILQEGKYKCCVGYRALSLRNLFIRAVGTSVFVYNKETGGASLPPPSCVAALTGRLAAVGTHGIRKTFPRLFSLAV